MQTPTMNANPIAAVAPAPAQQRQSSSSANAPANAAGFGHVLAREVSQHRARLQEQGTPDDRSATAAAPDGGEARTEAVGAKPASTGDKADGVAERTDTTPAAAGSEVPADNAVANELLALVNSLAPKPAAVAKADGAVAEVSGGGPASLRPVRRDDLAGNGVASGPAAADGRAEVDLQVASGKSTRQGAGRASGDGFAAAFGRVAEDAARNDGTRSIALEAVPDSALRVSTIATSPVVANALAVPGADRLAPRVGSTAWDNALGQRVVWMAGAHEQTASLTLNPPDLGPLQVVLSVTNNQADAIFVATQPEVRQALEAALPRLRDMLGDVGITLREATVSADSRESQQAFRQSQRDGGGTRDGTRAGTEAEIRISGGPARGGGRSLVDTFA